MYIIIITYLLTWAPLRLRHAHKRWHTCGVAPLPPPLPLPPVDDDDELMLNVLRCHETY